MRHLVDELVLAGPDDPIRYRRRHQVALALGHLAKEPRRREKRRAPGLAVRANPNPNAEVIAPDRVNGVSGALPVRLFRYTHKQGAGQLAVITDERCVAGLVVLTKKGRWPGVGAFLDQGFVRRTISVKFGIGSRL